MSEPVAVGVDVGGTKLVAASLGSDGAILADARATTPQSDPDGLVRAVVDLVASLDAPPVPVGLGIAGIVDPTGLLRYGPNLGLSDVPISELLADELRVSVTTVNDASAALYGEHVAGAGRGVGDLLMLTLGTGVGGALMIGGELVTGANGLAGELGHLIVLEGGRQCPCGNAGCLEAYASGTAIGSRATSRLSGAQVETRLEGTVDGKAVTTAAREGDPFAIDVLAEAGHWLGVGLASLVNAFDPERVLLGGGAGVNAGELLAGPAREAMTQRILGAAYRTVPELLPASLGDEAGMVGAGMFALQQSST